MPSVLSRILVAPLAKSRMFSAFCGRAPSFTAMCKKTVLLYRLRIRHNAESATSSTDAAGTLHTATPAWAKKTKISTKPENFLVGL